MTGVNCKAPVRLYAFDNELLAQKAKKSLSDRVFIVIVILLGYAFLLACGLAAYYHSLSPAERIILAFVNGPWQDAWRITRASGWPD